MKRIGVTLVAVGLVAALAAPARADAPSYSEGPSNGDASTFKSVDTGAGKITIFQHNTRQAGTVHCSGQGPRATLQTERNAPANVQKVSVEYVDAIMTEHPVIDVLVTNAKGTAVGHKATFGPKYHESGTVDVPIFGKVKAGEPLRILVGMQVHAGCLPHPFVLGLAGSRFAEGGQASFPSISIS